MTAMGQNVMPGDLVVGAHRSNNLAECLQLGYLVPAKEDELNDEELSQLIEDEVAAQAERLQKENPDMVVGMAGQQPPAGSPQGSPDVILQHSGNVAERARYAEIEQRAIEHAERGRSGGRSRSTSSSSSTPKTDSGSSGADDSSKSSEPPDGAGAGTDDKGTQPAESKGAAPKGKSK